MTTTWDVAAAPGTHPHAALVMSAGQIEADRARWLGIRRQLMTASDVAACCGVAPPDWGSPWHVYAENVTGRPIGRDKAAMQRGKALEPEIRAMVARDRPELVLADGGLYCSRERPWQAATLDNVGWDTSANGDLGPGAEESFPVELKTDATGEGYNAAAGVLPLHYWAQGLWQMDVWQADRVIFPVLLVMPWRLIFVTIHRTADAERDIALMRQAARIMLDRVANEDPPDIDWKPATSRALRFVSSDLEPVSVRVPASLARRRAAVLAAKQRVKERAGLVDNELLARMGTAKWAHAIDPATGEKVRVVSRSQYDHTSYDAEALRNDWPAAAAATERKTPVDKFSGGSWGAR